MTLIALLLAAAPASPPPRTQVARASVEIVAAEVIRFEPDPPKGRSKGLARQQRTRDGMPLVEFY